MSSRFSERALKCLEAAGWVQSRAVDTDNYLAALEKDGYDIPVQVREFLVEFGGLEIHYPHYRVAAEDDWCHFNASTATANVFPELVREWEEGIRSALTPIGEAFHNHMTLLMTPIGTIYAGYEDSFHLVGETPELAIEALCGGLDITETAE